MEKESVTIGRSELIEILEKFPWDSEDQKEGFLNFVQYSRKMAKSQLPPEMNNPLMVMAAYFIQKEHESNRWWRDHIAGIDKRHTEELRRLQRDIEELRGRLNRD